MAARMATLKSGSKWSKAISRKSNKGGQHPPELLEDLSQLRVNKSLLDYDDYLTLDLDCLRTEHRFKAHVWNQCFDPGGPAARCARAGKCARRPAKRLEGRRSRAGVDSDLLVFQIRTYTERTQVAHSDLRHLAQRQEWANLTRLTASSRAWVRKIIPWERKDQLEQFQAVIDRAEKRLFHKLRDGGERYVLARINQNQTMAKYGNLTSNPFYNITIRTMFELE